MITEKIFIIRLMLSVFLGFIIGAERQLTGHAAGIRINVLVSLGATMFTSFSFLVGQVDTTRIAAQIVTGVGFLCSAIIFKNGSEIRGLNTAATIWCTAAIGVLCSSSNWKYAMIATAILLLGNSLSRPLAWRLRSVGLFDDSLNYCEVYTICLEEKEFAVRSFMLKEAEKSKWVLTQLDSNDISSTQVKVTAFFQVNGKKNSNGMENMVTKIGLMPGVVSVGWEIASE